MTQVDLRQGEEGLFHYVLFESGQRNGRNRVTICGLDTQTLRRGAWFAVGDSRGRVHYDRACDVCRGGLRT